MSCSIPVIFHPQEYGTYLYTDGGASNGFPIEYMDLERGVAFNLYGDHDYERPRNMTLQDFLCRIVHAGNIHQCRKAASLPPHLRRRVVSVRVPCVNRVAISGFNLPAQEIEALMEQGRRAAFALLYPHCVQLLVFSGLYLRLRTLSSALATAESAAGAQPLPPAQQAAQLFVGAVAPRRRRNSI